LTEDEGSGYRHFGEHIVVATTPEGMEVVPLQVRPVFTVLQDDVLYVATTDAGDLTPAVPVIYTPPTDDPETSFKISLMRAASHVVQEFLPGVKEDQMAAAVTGVTLTPDGVEHGIVCHIRDASVLRLPEGYRLTPLTQYDTGMVLVTAWLDSGELLPPHLNNLHTFAEGAV
jgi:hypothetical protein